MKGIDAAAKVLTEIGWKSFDEIVESDKVAIYSLFDEKIKYEKISGLSLDEYEGKMYSIDNRWNDFFIPPESSLILRYIRSTTDGKKFTEKDWHIEKVKDITPHGGFLIINSGKYDGNYEIGELQAMLIGWIISLGHKNDSGIIEIHQSMELKEEDVEMLIHILDMLGVDSAIEINDTKIGDDVFLSKIIKIPNIETNHWIYEKFNNELIPKWEYFILNKMNLKCSMRA